MPEYDKLCVVREASGTGLAKIAPSNIYPTKDGKWVIAAANLNPMFRRLCQAMDRPELAEDDRYKTHVTRGENAEELDALIADWTKTKSVQESDVILNRCGVVVGPIYTIADIVEDRQFKACDMIRRIDDPVLGDIAVPGIVPRLDEVGGDIAWLGPPEVGSHNRENYGNILGLSDHELEELENDGTI